MRRLTRTFSLALAALVWSLAFGSSAWATGSVRLEYVKANNVLSAETISSSGASVQGSAAPDFGGVTGQVRVNGLSGAVIVTVASTNPVATQTNGYRIQSCSQALLLPISTGQKVAIIEATDANSCAAGGGGGGASTIASGADVVQGSTSDTSTSNTIYGVMQALKAAAQDTSTESPVKIADGSDATMGSKALSACSTDNGTCTLVELIKRLNQRLTTLDTDVNTLNTSVNSSVPAGTNEAMNLVKDTHAQCGALCANLVVKNSAGKLKTFEVSADSTLAAAIWYVILYDATAAPTDGAITPAKCYQQPAGSTQMGGTLSAGGSSFTTGITIGVSTTGCFTKTASTHAFIGADYQ
jgi:hypothetical protein